MKESPGMTLPKKTLAGTAVVGLLCWWFIISMAVTVLGGCGPTAKQASLMTSGQLVWHHYREIDIMDHADMDVVNEIVKRGGFPQSVADEYADGARIHWWVCDEQWGSLAAAPFDWQAMGWESWAAVTADPAFSGVSSGTDAFVVTPGGSFSVSNYGGGTFRVRGR